MIDDKSPNFNLPLPHKDNDPYAEDVDRIRSSFGILDGILHVTKTVADAAMSATDVDARFTQLIGAAPAALDTLEEIAATLDLSEDERTAIIAQIATERARIDAHDTALGQKLGLTATAANASRLGNQLPEYYAPASAATGRTASAIADWDDAINNGVYMASDALNAPVSGWCIGEVFRHADTWLTQRVWDFNGQRKVYVRFKSSGIWSAWTQITAANFKVFHPDNVHANFDLTNGLVGGKVPTAYALKADLPSVPTGLVTGVRLSAESYVRAQSGGASQWSPIPHDIHVPAGSLVTGSKSAFEHISGANRNTHYQFYKYLQIQVDGAWVTISG